MSKLHVKWYASGECQKREGRMTGVVGPRERTDTYELADMEPGDRDQLISIASLFNAASPYFVIDITHAAKQKASDPTFRQEDPNQWYETKSLELDMAPSFEDVIKIVTTSQAAREYADAKAGEVHARLQKEAAAKTRTTEAEFERLQAIYIDLAPRVHAQIAANDLAALTAFAWPDGYNPSFPEYDPYNIGLFWHRFHEPSLARLLSERHQALIAEQNSSAKAAWVNEHGSDYLKRACAAGHDCDRLYRIERAAVEYPGFILDYENNAEIKSRVCPSLAALDARDAALQEHPGITARIVWLVDEPLSNKDDYTDFEECEALQVDDPAYNHCLYRIF